MFPAPGRTSLSRGTSSLPLAADRTSWCVPRHRISWLSRSPGIKPPLYGCVTTLPGGTRRLAPGCVRTCAAPPPEPYLTPMKKERES